jgi:hypothetical protein
MLPTFNMLRFLATGRRKGTERSDSPALSNPTKYNSIPEIQKRTTEHRLGLHIAFLLLFTLGYTQQNYNFAKNGNRRRGNGSSHPPPPLQNIYFCLRRKINHCQPYTTRNDMTVSPDILKQQFYGTDI